MVISEAKEIKKQETLVRFSIISYKTRLRVFCLPHRPIISDVFDFCIHWVSVVRGCDEKPLVISGIEDGTSKGELQEAPPWYI